MYKQFSHVSKANHPRISADSASAYIETQVYTTLPKTKNSQPSLKYSTSRLGKKHRLPRMNATAPVRSATSTTSAHALERSDLLLLGESRCELYDKVPAKSGTWRRRSMIKCGMLVNQGFPVKRREREQQYFLYGGCLR